MSSMKPAVRRLFDELLTRYPAVVTCEKEIAAVYDALAECYEGGGKVLACGNGGSAADAEHIVGELMKGFLLKRPIPKADAHALGLAFPDQADTLVAGLQRALPAISLVSQTALITAFANDVNPDMIFAQQVYGYGRKGDVLIALSTSGNSANICNAVRVASIQGVKTIGLTGATGGRLKTLCEVCICVPAEMAYPVQELHLPVYHTLCAMVEEHFFGEGR